MTIKKLLTVFFMGLFWTSFLFAESGRFVNESDQFDQNQSQILTPKKKSDIVKERINNKKSIIRWENKTKLGGALTGGRIGMSITGIAGAVYFWPVYIALSIGLAALMGPLAFLAPFIALGIFGVFIGVSMAGGFAIGVPYGVAKTGATHGEDGKMWAAYLGEVVAVLLAAGLYKVGSSISSEARVVAVIGGVAGTVGMPILFYNLSRSRLQEKPEAEIRIPLLSVKF